MSWFCILTVAESSAGSELLDLLDLIGRDVHEVLPLLPNWVDIGVELITELVHIPLDSTFIEKFSSLADGSAFSHLFNVNRNFSMFLIFLSRHGEDYVCGNPGAFSAGPFEDVSALCTSFEAQTKLKVGSHDKCVEILRPLHYFLVFVNAKDIISKLLKSLVSSRTATKDLPMLVRYLYSFGVPSLLIGDFASVFLGPVQAVKSEFKEFVQSGFKAKAGKVVQALYTWATSGESVSEQFVQSEFFQNLIQIFAYLLAAAKKSERLVLAKTAASACGHNVQDVFPWRDNSACDFTDFDCFQAEMRKIKAVLKNQSDADLVQLEIFVSRSEAVWTNWSVESCKSPADADEGTIRKLNSLAQTLEAVRKLKHDIHLDKAREFNTAIGSVELQSKVEHDRPETSRSFIEKTNLAIQKTLRQTKVLAAKTKDATNALLGLGSLSGVPSKTSKDSSGGISFPDRWSQGGASMSSLALLLLEFNFDLGADLPELAAPVMTELIILEELVRFTKDATNASITEVVNAATLTGESWRKFASFAARDALNSRCVDERKRPWNSVNLVDDDFSNKAAQLGCERLRTLGLVAEGELNNDCLPAAQGIIFALKNLNLAKVGPKLLEFLTGFVHPEAFSHLNDIVRYIWFFAVPSLGYSSFVAKLNEHISGIMTEFRKVFKTYSGLLGALYNIFGIVVKGEDSKYMDVLLAQPFFQRLKALVNEILTVAQSNEDDIINRRIDKYCKRADLKESLEKFYEAHPLLSKRDIDEELTQAKTEFLERLKDPTDTFKSVRCPQRPDNFEPLDIRHSDELYQISLLSHNIKALMKKLTGQLQEVAIRPHLRPTPAEGISLADAIDKAEAEAQDLARSSSPEADALARAEAQAIAEGIAASTA